MEVLSTAGEVTATGLAERVRRIAIALDPGWAERRYRQALAQRRGIGYLNEDGSATVSGQHLPADQGGGAPARGNALAQAPTRAGPAAGIDLLRAEIFLGLLDGRFAEMTEPAIVEVLVARFRGDGAAPGPTSNAAPNSGVELRVGLATLLGRDERPGEI